MRFPTELEKNNWRTKTIENKFNREKEKDKNKFS